MLATAVSRLRWVAGHATAAFLGAAALVLLFAVGAGAAGGDPGGQLSTLVGAGLVQLPGILVIGALVIAAVGLVPRYPVPVSWAVLIASILIGPLFGPSLTLPR